MYIPPAIVNFVITTVSYMFLNRFGYIILVHKDGKDTNKCLWSTVTKCNATSPVRPCQRAPDNWPKMYDSVKQKKTYAIRYLDELPDFVETVSEITLQRLSY